MDFDIIQMIKERIKMRKILFLLVIAFSVNSFAGFLQVDPGVDYDPNDPMSFNLYAYVRNNPSMLLIQLGCENKQTKTKKDLIHWEPKDSMHLIQKMMLWQTQ